MRKMRKGNSQYSITLQPKDPMRRLLEEQLSPLMSYSDNTS